eukprot:m.66605 g.66605  ORF g.66605 m.66605 type:complete len:139 (-) comp12127_c0_seq1:33-449(-)
MDEIFEAISQGNAAQGIAVLKSKKGLNLETRDKDGMTCLMNACYKGMTDLVEMLIDSGADFNAKVFPHQYTPLMFAAMSGNADCVRCLMEYEPDVDVANSSGRNALDLAAFTGNRECARIISEMSGKAPPPMPPQESS